MQWTVSQLAVFAWFASDAIRSLVVRARAGCGKTTTIVEGIARYVAARMARKQPVRVLATSFARKITDVLIDRLAPLKDLGVQARSLNSLGFQFVRDAVKGIKLDESSRKFDLARYVTRSWQPEVSTAEIAVLAKLHTKCRALLPLATCGADLEALCEQFNLGPDEDMLANGWTVEGICEAAYDCMVLASKEYRVIDFADQIFLPLRNGWTRPLFDLAVVDETQDMDKAQLLLVQRSMRKGGVICVVGDDMQAIYGFRGADTTAIDRMKAELDASEIRLETTYRCPKLVVEMARGLTPILADFTATDDAPEGTIATNLDIAGMLESVVPGDFILSRTNAPLVTLCLSLLRKGTRAYVAGKDVGATLIGIVKRLKVEDIKDLGTALDAYTTKKTSKIKADKRSQDTEWLDSKLDYVNDESECIMAIADGALNMPEVFSRLSSLFADDGVGSVMLSTVHKAKGLESSNVYLCDGTFKMKSHDDLMVRYVAITRTKSTLHLVKGFEKVPEVALAA